MHRLTTLLFAFTVILSLCHQSYGQPQNIVLFLIDDLGWMDLGCQGSTYYQTPNIDKLAAEGVRFTDAYAACAVCSPTRASILTGKYPARLLLTILSIQGLGGGGGGDVGQLDGWVRPRLGLLLGNKGKDAKKSQGPGQGQGLR